MSTPEEHLISIMGGAVMESDSTAVALSCSVCGVVKWWEDGVPFDVAALAAAVHGADVDLGSGKLVIPDNIGDLDEDEGPDNYIARNSIRCTKCGDEVESTHRHDMAWCSCRSVAADGGHAYLRRAGDSWEDTSVVVPDEPRGHHLEGTEVLLTDVHHSWHCQGRPCPIHSRTDHPLRDRPQEWRAHDRMMVRSCAHDIAHRDPDERPVLTETGRPRKRQCVKDCDGCCGRLA